MQNQVPSTYPEDAMCQVCIDVLGSPGESKRAPRSSAAESKNKQTARDKNTSRVLLFGRIRELALYRAEVLGNRGFTVATPSTKQDAKEAIREGEFDAAVLTYTLSSDTVEELAQMLRQYCPACPLIVISSSGLVDSKIHPDETVVADEGPAALVAALRRVLHRQ